MHRYTLLVRFTLLIAIIAVFTLSGTIALAQTGVGAGSYTTTLPGGAVPPQGTIYKTANVTGKMATNEWWSSLAWHVYPNGSENLFPHPLMARAVGKGLNIGYPNALSITPDGRKYEYTWAGPAGSNEAMIIGTAGLNAAHTDIRVDGFSDWTVTADWLNGNLKATIGHGMPFVYATKGTTADAMITFISPPTIVSNSGGAVHATINGRAFGIYGPVGSTWTLSGVELRSSLAGKNYFSVAALPDTSAATFNDYKTHAMVFVTGSSVSWSYNPATANVASTYSLTTSVKEGTETRALQALYRHQWMNSTAVNTSYTYTSPRGEMRVLRGNSFVTNMKFTGVLPWLPDLGTYNRTQLYNYVNEIYVQPQAQRIGGGVDGDTYWVGKGLGRLAMLVPIAEQVGHTAARDTFLNDMKGVLQNWYTASPGETTRVFYYDNNWGTLIGYPASYGSNTELNDHHFHYGYYIMASAIIAMYDQNWASSANWGGMTDMLIRDAANWSTSETRFPKLRNFDPYAGHGWASGSQPFAAGNNQESSSESTNFSTALILWGAAIGNTAVRDLGVYLYTTEVAAIEQYWFDIDNTVFPNTNYSHNYVAMVWSDGGSYSTWWTANAEEIHGINLLPYNGGSLYLGKRPSYVNSFYNELVASNGGTEVEWADIIWMYQAMANPSAAISKFGSGGYTPEAGETKAHTYHWIHNFNTLGNFDPSVTGNIPTSAVFVKGSTRTYVAFNPSSTATTVTFSNGITLNVPARSMATSAGTGNPPTNTPSVPTNTPVAPTPTTPPSGTNLALNKPATASGSCNVNEGPEKAVNGSVTGGNTDKWCSTTATKWMQVDLGASYSINQFIVRHAGAGGENTAWNTNAFNVQLSTDGVNWGSAVVSVSGNTASVTTHNITPATGRHVRLNITNSGGDGAARIYEFEVYGSAVTSTPTRTNTPIGPTATRTNTPVAPTATRTNTPSTGNGSPYGGTPAAIPGTVQIENFNTGGQNVAVNDASAANEGGQYRTTEPVDIEATTDTGAGFNVGWTAAGEWMKYTVNVQTTGTYSINFRVASAQAGGTFHLEVDGVNVTGTMTVPNTGGWQVWTTVTRTGVSLTAGQRVLRLVMDAAGGNFNWMSFTTTTSTPVPPTATRTNTPVPAGGNVLYVIDGTTLAFSAGTGALTDTIASAGGGNWDGIVNNPLTYTVTGVTRTYNAAAVTQFNMFIDAGTSVGNATQVRISYDFTGDGTYDRLEIYNYFATDPVVGWENYTQANNIKSATGTFANLSNGRVRIEIWSALGNGTTNLRTSATATDGSQSRIVIPYN